MKSIVIPAVSSGIFRFPVNMCAELMVQTTCEYYATQTSVPSVQTIRFTDISEDICQKLTTLLDVSPYTEGLASGGYTSGHSEEMAFGMPQTTMSFSHVSHDTIRTSSGGTIRWKVGNIAKERVDSLVTSVGELADLSQGAVSAAILERAGNGLQREVSRVLAGNSLGDWEHVTTRSYNLHCREVYHIHCPLYYLSFDQTKNFVQAMLKLMRTANNSGMTSIAFPAIGAGKLNFPAKLIAEVLYEAAITFFSSQTRGSLKEIQFVLFRNDTKNIKAFEAEMQNVLQRGATRQFEYGAQGSSGTALRPELKANSSNDTGKTYTSFQEESNGVCRMRIGNMFVELSKGSIVNANTDVIVNSTNEEFALGAPLSQHIIAVGGNTIKQECQQFASGYLLQHGIATTSAGNFSQTKSIIHFMTNRLSDRVTDLKERIQKTLKQAEGSRMKSIAFPAIGTGNPNWKPQRLAEAVFKAIGHFAVTNPQHLLLVKIIIYQGSLLRHYKTEMQSEEGKCYDLNRRAQIQRRLGKLKQKMQGSNDAEADTVEQPDTVVFHILAKTNEALDATVQGIESFISTEFQKEEIPYDKNCGLLTPERQSRIKAVARANQTTVECLAKEFNKSSRLIIRGKRQNVNDTKLGLLHLLNQLQSEEKRRVEQEALKQKIQWRYQDEFNQYQAYDADINALIEESYQKKQRYVELELENMKLKIDFRTMDETSLPSRQTSKVYRVDLMKEAVDRLPLHWDPSQRHHAVIDLVKESDEYDKVQETFFKSLRSNQPRGWAFAALGVIGAGSGKFEIQKIQRIQNVELWKQYMAKKDSMSATARRSQQDLERELFHGTSHEAIKDINKTGFNRSYHGKNGQAYGRGTYFATSATYSGRFAQPDQQGNRCMYLCKVLTGDFTKGDESMIVPPPKSSTEKYDSVVDNQHNPSIFVVFYDAQAYPEYLITFCDV